MLRWSRAAVVAAFALILGSSAHFSALAPTHSAAHVTMAFGFLVILGLSAAFLGGPASTRRLLFLVIGGQAFIHVMIGICCDQLTVAQMWQPSMLLGHLAVGVLVVLWLAHGERMTWRLLDALAFQPLALAVSVGPSSQLLVPSAAAARAHAAGHFDFEATQCAAELPIRRGPPR